jgi:hypothetical protein
VGLWNFTRYGGGKNKTRGRKKAEVLISVSCGGISCSLAFTFPACFYRRGANEEGEVNDKGTRDGLGCVNPRD